MNCKYLLLFTLIISGFSLTAQNEINQFDEQGKRHGVWKKTFEGSSQIRYEGAFGHGKEIGVFNYYCSNCEDMPMIVKTFNEDDNIAHIQYLTKKGKLVSEGKMLGKNRIGEWVYYHEKANSVMTKEEYVDGKLDGLTITYYLNKNKTEEIAYKNGIREGINNYYSPDGVLLKKLQYKNDQLEGPAYYYDAHGNVVIEGNYKKDKKHGHWKYFEEGKLVKEEIYPKS